jgi:hypothetical protein
MLSSVLCPLVLFRKTTDKVKSCLTTNCLWVAGQVRVHCGGHRVPLARTHQKEMARAQTSGRRASKIYIISAHVDAILPLYAKGYFQQFPLDTAWATRPPLPRLRASFPGGPAGCDKQILVLLVTDKNDNKNGNKNDNNKNDNNKNDNKNRSTGSRGARSADNDF